MTNELSLEKYFLLIKSRARIILLIFAAGIAVAGLITYLTPKMYTATTTLNFDFSSANPLDSQGRTLAEDAYLFTQIDIIKSQNVAQKVEDSLTEYEWERSIEAMQAKNTVLDNLRIQVLRFFSNIGSKKEQDVAPMDGEVESSLEAPPSLGVQSPYSWFARMIRYDLFVEPRFNSRVVEVSYSSPDPAIAAMFANRFSEAYIATNLEMTTDPARKTTAWFDEQLKSLRKKLEDAQSALTAYQQSQGIVSSDERIDTETARLQDLSSQLVAAQASTRNAITAQQKLEQLLRDGKSLETFEPVLANSVIQSVKSDIRRLEGKRAEMSNSLGVNHPRRKQVEAELDAARQRLATEIRAIKDGINNTAELTKTREEDLAAALGEQKKLILDLKKEHDRIAVLKREVESAQATYNAALTQLNTTSMQSMLDQTNVSIIDPANVPSRPSSPRITKNLVLGALAGLLLGMGCVVFMELFVRRVHSKDDITEELGIPLLGHLKNI